MNRTIYMVTAAEVGALTLAALAASPATYWTTTQYWAWKGGDAIVSVAPSGVTYVTHREGETCAHVKARGVVEVIGSVERTGTRAEWHARCIG